MAACLALCPSLGCQPDADPAGLSEAHAAAIRDSVSIALDAFRERGSGPDPTAVGGSCSDSPAFRFYESGAMRYESAAGAPAAAPLYWSACTIPPSAIRGGGTASMPSRPSRMKPSNSRSTVRPEGARDAYRNWPSRRNAFSGEIVSGPASFRQ